MKRIYVMALFLCAFACGLSAQVVDTTVCAVLKNPKSFDGKIVRIKGTVAAGFDQFIVKDGECGAMVDGIWISYPQGTKAKSGPIAFVQVQPAKNFAGAFKPVTRTPVTLEKNKDFKQFDSLLSQAHNRGAGMCLGCTRYEVTATLVGRLDGVADANLERANDGKIIGFGGFGNLNSYPARLVLQSVSEITPKEVDFSKVDLASKGQMPTFGGNADLYDPVEAAQKSAVSLGSSPAGLQALKDVAAFGKRGDKTNGVSLVYGNVNEIGAKDDALGLKESPDGVLFNCTFNLDRLEGDAQVRAIIHAGQHIVDLRSPMTGNETAPLFILEYNGWSMTVATAASNGQKFLTAQGAYMLWDSTWTMAERSDKMSEALTGFLSKQEMLSK